MSYILDALKRADAERERGGVPGLHSRQVVPQASQAGRGARSRLWPAVAAATFLGVVAGAWVWRSAPIDTPVSAAGPAVPVPVAPVPPVPMAQPAPVSTPVAAPAPAARLAEVEPRAPASAPMPATRAAPAPAVVVEPAPPAVVPTVRPSVAPAVVPAQTLAQTQTQAPASAAPASAAAPPAAAGPAPRTAEPGPTVVPLLGELGEGVRRQIPALSITGVVYSEVPGQRILIVNNQVVTQGTQAAPEVQLEEIRARSAVFNFRGTRFQVGY